MLTMITVLWILIELSAPTWCYWCVGIAMFFKFLKLCTDLYSAGKESKS